MSFLCLSEHLDLLRSFILLVIIVGFFPAKPVKIISEPENE